MNPDTKKSVMLLDDDKFLVDMYSMKFVQQGYSVQACLSVKDALDQLKGGFKPDVILFDLVMPEHDGISFLKSLTEEKLSPNAVKIALTNQNEDSQREMVLDLGADQCIVKASVVPSEVVSMVEKALAEHVK